MSSKSNVSERPPLWKVWLVASRPHTLTAAVSPVLVAYNAGLSAIEDVDAASYLWLTLQWAAFCMLVQVGNTFVTLALVIILTHASLCVARNQFAQRLRRLCESKIESRISMSMLVPTFLIYSICSSGR